MFGKKQDAHHESKEQKLGSEKEVITAPNMWNKIGPAATSKIIQYLPPEAAHDFSLTCRFFRYTEKPDIAQRKPDNLEPQPKKSQCVIC